MSLSSLAMAILLVLGFGFFGYHARRLLRYMRLAGPIARTDQLGRRLGGVVAFVLGQRKLFKDPVPGLMHCTIFWGFLILTVGTLEVFALGLQRSWSFAWLGPLYGPLYLAQDVLAALVILAVAVAVVRRLIVRPWRLASLGSHAQRDALFILGIILLLMVTILGSRAAALALGTPEGAGAAWQPCSQWVRPLLTGLSPAALAGLHDVAWCLHGLLELGFLCYLPFTKPLPLVTAPPTVVFPNLCPLRGLPLPRPHDQCE